MSPALAHECPYTPPLALPCKPRVRAGLYTPRSLPSEGAPTHVPVEAPCSALGDYTVEERLYARARAEAPCSVLVNKQLRAASQLW